MHSHFTPRPRVRWGYLSSIALRTMTAVGLAFAGIGKPPAEHAAQPPAEHAAQPPAEPGAESPAAPASGEPDSGLDDGTSPKGGAAVAAVDQPVVLRVEFGHVADGAPDTGVVAAVPGAIYLERGARGGRGRRSDGYECRAQQRGGADDRAEPVGRNARATPPGGRDGPGADRSMRCGPRVVNGADDAGGPGCDMSSSL